MSGGWTPGLVTVEPGVHEEASILASEDKVMKRSGATISAATVAADINGDRILHAGTFLSVITASGKYGPYQPLQNEVQQLAITGAPTGGTFTITFAGQTTAAIPYNATADQVETALKALSNIGQNDVNVIGGPGPATAWQIEFGGQYAGVNVAAITTTNSFTGGTSPNTTITTPTGGGNASAPADGREALTNDTNKNQAGYLENSVNLRNGDVMVGVILAGSVLAARVQVDSTIRTCVAGRIIFQ